MKITVIGAGLGGLATSCLLAKKGYEVTVFEKNSEPGGKINQVISNGFRFDSGPSLLTMPGVLDDVFRLCGCRLEDHLSIKPLNPLGRYFYSDDIIFDSYSDHTKSLEAVRRIAPEDEAAYSSFLDYASSLYDKTAPSYLYNPLQRFSDLSGIKLADFFRIDPFITVSERVDKSFRSEYLRQFFKRFTTYNGSSPFKAPATFNVISHIELNQGGYYVDGGMYKIAGALFALAGSLGVQFRFNAAVHEIITEKKTIKGVAVKNDVIRSDILVANSDAAETFQTLISPGKLSFFGRKRLNKIQPSCSGFVMLLGTDTKYADLIHHNIFFSDNYRREFDDIFEKLIMPLDPTIYIANTSFSNPDHAVPGGSNLFVLVNAPYLTDRYDWDKHSEDYGNFIINTLEKRGLTDLKQSIRFKKIINPKDFYERYRSYRGSIYGSSSNNTFAAFMRPRNKSPWFKNLYLTGGSTHPGGGIPLVLLSALNVAKLIERNQN